MTLLVGEPLAPEERMYADDLEAIELSAEGEGADAWATAAYRRVSAPVSSISGSDGRHHALRGSTPCGGCSSPRHP